VACDFDAIHMNANQIPVVDIDKCVACNDCVEICPKELFVLMPISQKLIVQCKSLLEGDKALDRCSVACNACGRCASDASPGVITMKNNLPVIDYQFNALTHPQATFRCPTGAIVWLEDDRQFALHESHRQPVANFDQQTYYQ
jgi:Fe-S-cluster-containing hydrogenase component 2